MRMRGEVLEVKTLGDQLEVRLQTIGAADAGWRRMNVVMFQCADLPVYRKALHVGRSVRVDIVVE